MQYHILQSGYAHRNKFHVTRFSVRCFLSNAVLVSCQIYCIVEVAGTHVEAVLNKRIKQELLQLVLNTHANMDSQVSAMTMKSLDILH